MNEYLVLPSATYKFRTPFSEKAFYFTVVGEPVTALFINSKDMEGFEWLLALMKSYARQLQNGVNVESVIKDMKETFDLKGSYPIPDGSGDFATSFVCHLGILLERHVKQNPGVS